MIDFEEIAVLDRNAQYLGVPTITLMENAGAAVAKAANDQLKNSLRSAVIFCGLGNNGGDGMVAGRYFAYNTEVYVKLYLLGTPGDIRTNLATEQYYRLPERVDIVSIKAEDEKAIRKLDLSGYSVIIDAMLGVGITGKLREPYKAIVNLINSLHKTDLEKKTKSKSSKKKKMSEGSQRPMIISVDVPTGLGTDSMIKPDITVTFHDSKTGMNKNNAGKILVRDIGIPEDAGLYVGPGDLVFYPQFAQDSHKGDSGKILIIGGGPYTGAPCLVGLGALRTGSDLIHISAPASISDILASYSPNFIIHSLNRDKDHLIENDLDKILSVVKSISADCVIIGPGLGKAIETVKTVVQLLNKLPKDLPIVIDADGFSALANSNTNDLKKLFKNHTGILTPHQGELNKLLKVLPLRGKAKAINKLKKKNSIDDLQSLVKQFANSLGGNWTVLYKGKIDIISDGKNLKLNRTGNVGMTVGGTGDVLAGISGALLGMDIQPFNAARAAAFISGYSGDLAWEQFGKGLMATDVIEMIPKCMLEFRD